MEQASGSILTGIRAFSAHLLSLTCLFYYYSITVVVLYCSSVLRLLSGEYRCLVLVDSVEDIYVGDPLFPLLIVIIINPPKHMYIYIPLPLAVLSLTPPAVTNVIL